MHAQAHPSWQAHSCTVHPARKVPHTLSESNSDGYDRSSSILSQSLNRVVVSPGCMYVHLFPFAHTGTFSFLLTWWDASAAAASLGSGAVVLVNFPPRSFDPMQLHGRFTSAQTSMVPVTGIIRSDLFCLWFPSQQGHC
eukprot:TRINITY_DN10025_c0_g1_i2.p1 TRINITY_DN10025_c0_g1~~TRINITY_DN10025_c0_g1_i2.p1  ORF type:complete len:139 (+),score=7.80 TRINITY_DN10025_c0_g1_i2:109-525(+)